MLKISLMEFFTRTIPESFLFVLTGYLFAKKNIDKKTYCTSSMVLAMCIYIIRMLPIHYGVHTIINIIICILIIATLNKIPVIQSITASLFAATILSICELVNFFILESILKLDIESMLNNSLTKVLNFIPSLILFALIILIFYVSIYKNKKRDESVIG
ncbi:hypothetical protein [Clostridium rectalis]|uniref:hypothetical protein n=1 Tax=Clostridium rectalis TaxID=2040295 RepID=UPI000F62E1AF|nr:hypothetical protein [Clostridium rectalis]